MIIAGTRSYMFTVEIFSFNNSPIIFPIIFDKLSIYFSCTVILISTVIMFYSFFYIYPYSKRMLFIWTTLLFVLSILLLIFIPSLFFIMLGWDGLGIVSFFLIMYYQRDVAIYRSLITVFINRFGDRLFITTIA